MKICTRLTLSILDRPKILTLLALTAATSRAQADARIAVKTGLIDSILNANVFVQFLLLAMAALSVTSWAIIVEKFQQYKKTQTANDEFQREFWNAASLEDIFDYAQKADDSCIAAVFRAAYAELQRLAESGLASGGSNTAAAPSAHLSGLDNLERSLRKSVENEIAALERRLGFLATTGSTAPFVGLLGTVVGIMTSFSNIAASGSASLAVVAPGISEALFSTAVGLFAALPAVAAYNFFIGKVRRIEMDLNSFGADFLNIAKRNFFKGS